eukprot:UN00562
MHNALESVNECSVKAEIRTCTCFYGFWKVEMTQLSTSLEKNV